jgi:SSS family solute:Na+ symporter
MQEITLEPLDLSTIAFRVARRTYSADDLFLAGHRLTRIPVGLSRFASSTSSATLIDLACAACTREIAAANYAWMTAPIPVIFAVVLVPLYLSACIGTAPGILEYRFDLRAHAANSRC